MAFSVTLEQYDGVKLTLTVYQQPEDCPEIENIRASDDIYQNYSDVENIEDSMSLLEAIDDAYYPAIYEYTGINFSEEEFQVLIELLYSQHQIFGDAEILLTVDFSNAQV